MKILRVIYILSLIGTAYLSFISPMLIIGVIGFGIFFMRPSGTYVKTGSIFPFECMFLFIYIMLVLVFGELDYLKVLLHIVCILIRMGVVYYDDKTYVYITDERKVDVSRGNT